MTTRTKVAVVEDDFRIRDNLVAMLKTADDFECVAQCANAEDALHEIPRHNPQLVLMDINLPGMGGIECVRMLAARNSMIQIIMLTCSRDPSAIFSSLQAGACGYLLKPLRTRQLLDSLREVINGGSPLSNTIARQVVNFFRQTPNAINSQHHSLSSYGLTTREQEILQFLSEGLLYKEISSKLRISYATVRTHIERIYNKLQVQSRAQAVAKATGHLSH